MRCRDNSPHVRRRQRAHGRHVGFFPQPSHNNHGFRFDQWTRAASSTSFGHFVYTWPGVSAVEYRGETISNRIQNLELRDNANTCGIGEA
jgi:hypothetical protein